MPLIFFILRFFFHSSLIMTLVISLSQPVGADEPEEILTIGIFAYRPVE